MLYFGRSRWRTDKYYVWRVLTRRQERRNIGRGSNTVSRRHHKPEGTYEICAQTLAMITQRRAVQPFYWHTCENLRIVSLKSTCWSIWRSFKDSSPSAQGGAELHYKLHITNWNDWNISRLDSVATRNWVILDLDMLTQHHIVEHQGTEPWLNLSSLHSRAM